MMDENAKSPESVPSGTVVETVTTVVETVTETPNVATAVLEQPVAVNSPVLTGEQVNANIQKAVDTTVKKTRKGRKKLDLTKSVFSTTERNDGWLIETNQKRFIKKLQKFGITVTPIEGSKDAVTAIVPFKWVSIRKSRVGMSPNSAAKINAKRQAKIAEKQAVPQEAKT